MWLDKDGVAHTAAVPNPQSRVDPAFLSAVHNRLSELDDNLLDDLEVAAIDAAVSSGDYSQPRDKPLPKKYKIGAGVSADGKSLGELLRAALLQLPIEWRLDAILIIGDMLDEWGEA